MLQKHSLKEARGKSDIKGRKKTIVVSARTDVRLVAGLLRWLDSQGKLPEGNMSEAIDLCLECLGVFANVGVFDSVVEALEYLTRKGYSTKQYQANDSRSTARSLLNAVESPIALEQTLPKDLHELAVELENMKKERESE
jgi:hypothetical protein